MFTLKSLVYTGSPMNLGQALSENNATRYTLTFKPMSSIFFPQFNALPPGNRGKEWIANPLQWFVPIMGPRGGNGGKPLAFSRSVQFEFRLSTYRWMV